MRDTVKFRTVQLEGKAATAFQRIVTVQALTKHTNLCIIKNKQKKSTLVHRTQFAILSKFYT